MKKPRLSRRKKHHANKIGLPPGALVYVGDAVAKNLEKPKVSKIIYDANGNVVKEFRDGLPSKVRFVLPAQLDSFTLEVPGSSFIKQSIVVPK